MSSTVEKLTEQVMALPLEAKKTLANQLAENLGDVAETAFQKD